jgi:DNA-binding NarL/FixJ family response regulator
MSVQPLYDIYDCCQPGRFYVIASIEDELLRMGIRSLLAEIPAVEEIVLRSGSLNPAVPLHEKTSVINIITCADWARRPVFPAESQTRLLVLLDESTLLSCNILNRWPADGYLLRESLDSLTLSRALSQLAVGEMVIPRRVAQALGSGRPTDVSPPGHYTPALTAREQQTLSLLVTGLSNKQIARRLQLSEHGAKRLVSSVLLKLDAPNRTSAVVSAMKLGLVPEG